jgi:hypothetical protein
VQDFVSHSAERRRIGWPNFDRGEAAREQIGKRISALQFEIDDKLRGRQADRLVK